MKNKLEQREDQVLSSFEGIQPAEVPPYFYTRLAARMQRELEAKKPVFIILRPAFLTASLSVILIINIVFLFQFNGQNIRSSDQSNNAASIETFADAYGLNTKAVYE
ncbi:MAG: hypothetical protein ABI741_03165 [Ferruginibacter sp.]